MKNITGLCEPQFDDVNIIDRRLLLGAREHVSRMVADNAGGLKTPMINLTNTAILNLSNLVSSDEIDSTSKESLGILTDEDVVLLKQQMRRTYGSMIGLTVLPAPVLHAFFPNKLFDVNHLSKANYTPTLARMISASGTYSAYVPAGTLAAYSGLKTTLDTDTGTHTASKAVVKTDDTDTNATSKILRDQLTDNVCDLSKMYRLVLGKAATFFTQSTFFPVNHHTHQHFSGTFAPQERIVVIHLTFEEGTEVYVKSKSLGKISGWILVNPGDPLVEIFTVDAEKGHTFHSELIGGATGTYLVLINDNLVGGVDVDWEVDVID